MLELKNKMLRVRIEEAVFLKLKKHCEENNSTMSKEIMNYILKLTEEEKKCIVK